jgi:lipoprotein-releasing system permease protein
VGLSFELFIATRYLLARRKQAFISVISLISGIGLAVGVTAVLIVLALMTGLQGEMRDRIVGAAAHIYVQKVGGFDSAEQEVSRLLSVPRVIAAAPTVLGFGLVQAGGGNRPLTLKGVDPVREKTVSTIAGAMIKGSFDALAPSAAGSNDALPGILIGKELAEELGVTVDDTVEVLTVEGTLSPFGMLPRPRAFRVVGIYALELFEFDSAYGIVHLSVAERMLDRPRPDFIEVKVDDLFAAREVAADIADRLGDKYVAEDWAEQNKSLFNALWLEKMAMSIAIGLIVAVAALNIIASLIMLVMEKTRDIAILKTMGASSASIRRIFMLQGLIIGVVGTGSGAILGTSLIYLLDHYKLIRIELEVYQITNVPFKLQPLDFVVVVVTAVLVCFLATIYPSRQASRLDPAQALRYQ